MVANDRIHLKTMFWQPLYAQKQEVIPLQHPGQLQLNSFSMLQISDPEIFGL
jgi:hypothetical protein